MASKSLSIDPTSSDWQTHQRMLIENAHEQARIKKEQEAMKECAEKAFLKAVESDPALLAPRIPSTVPLNKAVKSLLGTIRAQKDLPQKKQKDFSSQILKVMKGFTPPPLKGFNLRKIGSDLKTVASIKHAICALPKHVDPNQVSSLQEQLEQALQDIRKMQQLREQVESQMETAKITYAFTMCEKAFKVTSLSTRVLELEQTLSIIRIKKMQQNMRYYHQKSRQTQAVAIATNSSDANTQNSAHSLKERILEIFEIAEKSLVQIIKSKREQIRRLSNFTPSTRIDLIRKRMDLQLYFKQSEMLRKLKPLLVQMERYTKLSDTILKLEKDLKVAEKTKSSDAETGKIQSAIIKKQAERIKIYNSPMIGNKQAQQRHLSQVRSLQSFVTYYQLKEHIPLDSTSYSARIDNLLERWKTYYS